MTVNTLLQTIRTNLDTMLARAVLGASNRDPAIAFSFKRWLSWNETETSREMDYLLHIERFFVAEPRATEARFNELREDVAGAVRPESIGLADARQVMNFFERKLPLFETEKTKRNALIAHNTIERVRSLIDGITRFGSFTWFKKSPEGREAQRWIDLILSNKALIESLGSTCRLTAFEEAWNTLQTTMREDDKLRKRTNELLDHNNARRAARETRTRFERLKEWFGERKDRLTENAFVRFFKNFWFAITNPISTCQAIGTWVRANPWKGALMILGGVLGLALCVGLPLLAPVIAPVVGGIVSAEVALGTLVGVGAAGTMGLALVTTSAAGSLARTPEDELTRLEREAEEAENRATAAEAKADREEATARARQARFNAETHRNAAERDRAEAEVLGTQHAAALSRAEAIGLRQAAVHARIREHNARARQAEREALLHRGGASELAVEASSLQSNMDTMDEMSASMEFQENAAAERMTALAGETAIISARILAESRVREESRLAAPVVFSDDDSGDDEKIDDALISASDTKTEADGSIPARAVSAASTPLAGTLFSGSAGGVPRASTVAGSSTDSSAALGRASALPRPH